MAAAKHKPTMHSTPRSVIVISLLFALSPLLSVVAGVAVASLVLFLLLLKWLSWLLLVSLLLQNARELVWWLVSCRVGYLV
jgi:hypothetical protein